MYEAYYLLRTRPFGVGNCWLAPQVAQSVQHAIASLQNGSEIVLVTGPTGSGKSAICRELSRQMSSKLQAVMLAHCEFGSAGELWRTIQFEAGLDPIPTSNEDDARLGVLRAARGLRPQLDGMLIVADDADALSNSLLDELRRLTVQRHEGRPVVQLVLSGTFALEERLANPDLSSLTHRIGQHIVLETLSRDESRQYITFRVQDAGGQLHEVFTEAALNAIIAAGDGNLHCLNQLCDHSLLLGFANEVRPVTADIVNSALEDLKGLSLPWNVPNSAPIEEGPTDESSGGGPATDTAELEKVADDLTPPLGAEDRRSWWDDVGDAAAIEVGAEASLQNSGPEDMVLSDRSTDALPDVDSQRGEYREFAVDDSYAALDRLGELHGSRPQPVRPPMVSRTSAPPSAPPVVVHEPVEPADSSNEEEIPTHKSRGVETRLLIDVTELRNEIRAAAASPEAPARAPAVRMTEMASADPDWDIVQPEPDAPAAHWAETSVAEAEDSRFGEDSPQIASATLRAEEVGSSSLRTESETPRRYARLFTRLQQRRAAAAADATSRPLRLWR